MVRLGGRICLGTRIVSACANTFGESRSQSFHLLEYPALMTELALEQEMEDLNGCALASWEGILEKLNRKIFVPGGNQILAMKMCRASTIVYRA